MHHHHWRAIIAVLSAITLWTLLIGVVLCLLEKRCKFVSRFFQEKRTPLDLAIFRIALMFIYFFSFHPVRLLNFAKLDPALIVPPTGWGALAAWFPRNIYVVEGIEIVFAVCAGLALIGLWTKVTCWLAVISNFYLMTLPQLFGKINHGHHLVLFGLLLALSPCGDALSMDAFLLSRRGKGIPPLAAATRYARPLQFVILLMGIMYFYPGAWKIARNGFAWFSGSNLHYIMVDKLAEAGATQFQQWVVNQPALLVAGSVFTVVFEMGWILLAMNRRSRVAGFVVGLSFHNLTRVLMNIGFWELQICYVALIDWGAILRQLSPRIRSMQRTAGHWAEAKGEVWMNQSLGRGFASVAGLFVVSMILAGMGHSLTSWPVACYPTFEDGSPNVEAITKMDVANKDGRISHETLEFDPILQARFGPERWRGMLDSLSPDAPAERIQALVRLWAAAHNRGGIASAAIYSDMYDLAINPPKLVLHTEIGRVNADAASGLIASGMRQAHFEANRKPTDRQLNPAARSWGSLNKLKRVTSSVGA